MGKTQKKPMNTTQPQASGASSLHSDPAQPQGNQAAIDWLKISMGLDTAPLLAPVGCQNTTQDLNQLVHTLPSVPPGPLPKLPMLQAAERQQKLSSKKPQSVTLKDQLNCLPLKKDAANALKKEMKTIDSKQQHGLFYNNQAGAGPTASMATRTYPKVQDMVGMRSSQMLQQISGAMFLWLKNKGKSPTEVQTGWGAEKGGGFDLFTSENDPDNQKLLAKQFNPNDLGGLLKGTKHKEFAKGLTDKEYGKEGMHLSVGKLLNHDLQKDERLEHDLNNKGTFSEDYIREDHKLTNQIFDKFMKGDFKVVQNPAKGCNNKRHAEQVIAAHLHEQQKYLLADIQGTRIRCGGCAHQLGYNLQLQDPNSQQKLKVSGRNFPGNDPNRNNEARTKSIEKEFKDHVEGNAHMESQPYQGVPLSDSPIAENRPIAVKKRKVEKE
jgi:hypothetical protein